MGRTPAENPFTPGFGNLPRVFAGRRGEFADLDLMVERLASGIYEQARMVTADRGFGKTVLLREFEEEQLEAGRWVVRASATPGDVVLTRIRRKVAELASDEDLDLEEDPDGAVLENLLGGLATLAREHDTVLLLLVDEAQNISLEALGELFHAIQEVQTRVVRVTDPESGAKRRDSLPFGAVVAGLPGLVGRLREAGSTFGERSKPLPLDAFGEADMREGLRALAKDGGADFDAEALEIVMEACGGYPYFLHLYGHEVWNAGKGDVITVDDTRRGIAAARPVVEDFYEQRLRELGKRQREYLVAAAGIDDEDRTSAAVADAMGRATPALGSTQQALIDRHGLLRRTGDGRLVFTLPGLAAHLA
ncbi:MAG: ATP-binding protein [Nitriliruptorales bacterium]|nr:ATP-binding protein [Nitriliruptorales bacterium]